MIRKWRCLRVDFIRKSIKPLLIAIAFTLFFVFPIPFYQKSWAYPFSFSLIVFLLPTWIENDRLSLFWKIIWTLSLGILCAVLIWLFCEPERINRYLTSFFLLYGLAIPVLFIKRCCIKWIATQKKP